MVYYGVIYDSCIYYGVDSGHIIIEIAYFFHHVFIFMIKIITLLITHLNQASILLFNDPFKIQQQSYFVLFMVIISNNNNGE